MLKDWPIEKLAWWGCLKATGGNETRALHPAGRYSATIPAKLYPQFRLVRTKAFLLENLWGQHAARSLRQAIEASRPDAIWTIPHQWSTLPLANVLPQIDQSYHVTVHDYPAHHQQDSLSRKRTAQLAQGLECIYQNAQSRDVISDEMNVDLKQRTGQRANYIFNAGVEPDEFESLERWTRRQAT